MVLSVHPERMTKISDLMGRAYSRRMLFSNKLTFLFSLHTQIPIVTSTDKRILQVYFDCFRMKILVCSET